MILPVPQPLAVFPISPIPLFPTRVGGSYDRYFIPPKKKGNSFELPKIFQHTKNYDNFLDGSAALIAPLIPCNFL